MLSKTFNSKLFDDTKSYSISQTLNCSQRYSGVLYCLCFVAHYVLSLSQLTDIIY